MPVPTNTINKVTFGGDVLIDLTGDTVTAAHLETGYTAHDRTGAQIIGSLSPGGSPTLQSKTVTPSESSQEIEADSGYDGLDKVTVNAIPSAYVNALTNAAIADTDAQWVLDNVMFVHAQGQMGYGIMDNNGAVSATIDPGNTYTIPQGYHNGNGTVTANAAGTLTYVNFNAQLGSSAQTSTSNVLDVGEAGNAMRYGGSLFNRGSSYTATLTLQGSQNNSTWTDITSATRSSGGQTAFNGTNSTYRYYRLRLGNSKSNNIACGMMMVCIK